MSSTSAIAGAIKEGLSLWKEFIATRQETYERNRDKTQVKCVRNADDIVDRIKELGIDDKELNKLIKKHKKYNN